MHKLKVFISSTMDDMVEERKALVHAINTNRFWESVHAESFVARSESPREVCIEEVRKSHIYIGIFKKKYGYIPKENNPNHFSVTVIEYNEAKKNAIPIFIFIAKNTDNVEEKLQEFLIQLTDFDHGFLVSKYTTAEDLVNSVLDSINYEVTKSYIENANQKRSQLGKDLYKLPYFKRFQERLKNG